MVAHPVSGQRRGKFTSRRRTGYTMFELMLVLAILAAAVAIAWPNVLRLNSQQKLLDSAEKVRAVAASARVHAIESGLVYQFRYEPGGRNFLVVPFEREFEAVNPNTKGTGTALGRFSKASGTLPERVTFIAPKLYGSTPSSGSTLAASGTGQRLPSALLSGLANAGQLENVSWSGPVLFQPDGSASDMSLDLIDRYNQRITLKIRGITGAIGVSRIHREERP